MRMGRGVWPWVLVCSGLWAAACGDDDGGDPPDGGANESDAAVKAGRGGAGGRSGAGGAGGRGGVGGHGGAGDEREVTIRFEARVGDRAFACGEEYSGQGSTDVTARPRDFRFYVQRLRLIDADGREVPVKLAERTPWQTPEVALIDFEDQRGGCKGTAETNTTITGTVPAGEYRGVVFSNGVPVELNHSDPATYPAPLQVSSMAWNWLAGFKFLVAELQATGLPEPEPEPDAGHAPLGAPAGVVHVGSRACTRAGGPTAAISCKQSNRNQVRLGDFDPDSDTIIADLGALFAQTDLKQGALCHSEGPACAPLFERLGIDFASGEPREQHVYRVK